MIIYSFTFSPLFQIDFQLCLRSTIYNTDQTWGGLVQVWIKQQVSLVVVLTCCLLVDCKALEEGPWNNCSKCKRSVSWARSQALSVLLGLSEKQKQCRFLSVFVMKKVFWWKCQWFYESAVSCSVSGIQGGPWSCLQKVGLFFRVKKCDLGPRQREEVVHSSQGGQDIWGCCETSFVCIFLHWAACKVDVFYLQAEVEMRVNSFQCALLMEICVYMYIYDL